MAVPATVVYFTSYEQFKIFLGYRHDGSYSENWFKPVLAGSGARGRVYWNLRAPINFTVNSLRLKLMVLAMM